MTMISTSRPLALNVPQSRAAKSGSAVMVRPALEILTLVRFSWLDAVGALRIIRISANKTCQTDFRGGNRFMTVLYLILLKNSMNASTRLSMNGKPPMISTAPPFVLRLSKDERKVFQRISILISEFLTSVT